MTVSRSELWTPATGRSTLRSRYPELHRGLLGWWYAPVGRVPVDVSRGRKHGTVDGTAAYTGVGWKMLANNDKLVLPACDLSGGYTVSMWLAASSNVESWAGLLSQHVGSTEHFALIRSSGSDDFRVVHSNNSKIFAGLLTQLYDAGPKHVVTTWDGATIEVWIDGESQGTQAQATAPGTGGTELWVGSNRTPRTWIGTEFLELALYDRVISAQEVKILSRSPGIAAEAIRVPMVSVPAAGGGITITATPQTYTITPQPVAITVGRSVTATPQSYAITAESVGVTVGRTVAATPQTYTMTPETAAVTAGRSITATPQSYAITAETAAVTVGRTITALPQSYVITAQLVGISLPHGDIPGAVLGGLSLVRSLRGTVSHAPRIRCDVDLRPRLRYRLAITPGGFVR